MFIGVLHTNRTLNWCFTYSITSRSNAKRFLTVLIVFGKYFVLKISKTMQLCFGDLAWRVKPVAIPSHELT